MTKSVRTDDKERTINNVRIFFKLTSIPLNENNRNYIKNESIPYLPHLVILDKMKNCWSNIYYYHHHKIDSRHEKFAPDTIDFTCGLQLPI